MSEAASKYRAAQERMRQAREECKAAFTDALLAGAKEKVFDVYPEVDSYDCGY